MTTVAYLNGELAADSRITEGTLIINETYHKVRILPCGALVGLAGSVSDAETFFRWAEKLKSDDITKASSHPPIGEYDGIWVRADGSYCFLHDALPLGMWIDPSVPGSIGSGSPAALGALHAGSTPLQAVMAALKVDTLSGGEVRIQRISIKKKK